MFHVFSQRAASYKPRETMNTKNEYVIIRRGLIGKYRSYLDVLKELGGEEDARYAARVTGQHSNLLVATDRRG